MKKNIFDKKSEFKCDRIILKWKYASTKALFRRRLTMGTHWVLFTYLFLFLISEDIIMRR